MKLDIKFTFHAILNLTILMTNRNIEMNIKTESGYDVLYPLTTPQQAGSLPITGGTLTGPLYLSSSPSNSSQAATKQYVDNTVSNWVPTSSTSGWKEAGTFNITIQAKDTYTVNYTLPSYAMMIRLIINSGDGKTAYWGYESGNTLTGMGIVVASGNIYTTIVLNNSGTAIGPTFDGVTFNPKIFSFFGYNNEASTTFSASIYYR